MALTLAVPLLPPARPALAADCPCTIDTAASGASATLGDVGGNEIWAAQTFTSPGNGAFSGFKVQFGSNGGSPTGNATWTLYGDYLGQPGLAIATGTVTPVASTLVTVNVTNGPTLNSGGLYWLTFTVPAQANDTLYRIASSSTSSYSGGFRYSSTNGAAWVVSAASDLALIISVGALVATSTPESTATPGDTPTPTITPSPTSNYAIEVTATSGAPMKLERTATYGDLTTFGGLLIVGGMLFFLFVYTYWRDRSHA